MATYTNKFPTDYHRGDQIIITNTVTLSLPVNIEVTLDMHGARGGTGIDYMGGIYKDTPGGKGGRLLCPNMELETGTYSFTIGAVGVHREAGHGYQGPKVRAGDGGTTTFKYGSTIIAEVLGGQGSFGTYRYVVNGVTGESAIDHGIPGADRGASVIPSGGIEYVGGSSSNGNGTVTLTITQVGAKPIIHCELSGNQGTKNRGFAVPYSISDADGDTVTVVEKLDGVVKRTHTPALMEPQECQALLTHDFLALTNGTHELTLEAEDIGATADTVELRFEKNVTSCTITLSEPLPADAMPEAMRLAINGYWTQYAIWTAEVCNNAFDAQPTWEDIKQSILSGYNYPFTNNTKTADKWGINFRISFSRGPSDQGGYIYSIEGGYQ